jgi:hypothetical protein
MLLAVVQLMLAVGVLKVQEAINDTMVEVAVDLPLTRPLLWIPLGGLPMTTKASKRGSGKTRRN